MDDTHVHTNRFFRVCNVPAGRIFTVSNEHLQDKTSSSTLIIFLFKMFKTFKNVEWWTA